MRRIFLIILASLSVSLSGIAVAKKSKIELSDEKEVSSAELRKRIRALQEAVIDLQSRVDSLESKSGGAANSTASAAPATVTCYIETPFDGVYDSTDVNETKARVEAVKACMNKVKSRIHCSAEKVKCGN